MNFKKQVFSVAIGYLGTVGLFYVWHVDNPWINGLVASIGFYIFYYFAAPIIEKKVRR